MEKDQCTLTIRAEGGFMVAKLKLADDPRELALGTFPRGATELCPDLYERWIDLMNDLVLRILAANGLKPIGARREYSEDIPD